MRDRVYLELQQLQGECLAYSGGSLPCSFGASGRSLCEFSLDANDLVQRGVVSGTLYLNSKRIKGLREDVFDNMGAVRRSSRRN
jgi:hypothetical protein